MGMVPEKHASSCRKSLTCVPERESEIGRERVCARVCECVCEREGETVRGSVCVCVCVGERESVCVCEREREREMLLCPPSPAGAIGSADSNTSLRTRLGVREREGGWVCEKVCECVRERAAPTASR